jgi:nucleoside-diphosphate kinase
MTVEETLVLVKPDGVARNLTGEILRRIEAKGYQLVDIKLLEASRELLTKHYEEHEGKPFFEGLLAFITSGPIVAMILEGPNAIEAARQIIGATNGLEAAPGSIRGDYAIETRRNLVHGSDSPESAEREIAIYFAEDASITAPALRR